MKKVIMMLIFMGAIFSSCDKCKNVECATPPPVFEFEILNKQTNENLFTTKAFSQNQISSKDKEGKAVPHIFISEDERNTFRLQEIGLKTEKIHYTINIADEVIFDLKIDMERKQGDCCDFTVVHSIEIENIEFSIDKARGVIKIFVEH